MSFYIHILLIAFSKFEKFGVHISLWQKYLIEGTSGLGTYQFGKSCAFFVAFLVQKKVIFTQPGF